MFVLLSAGCGSRQLMKTPNLYLRGDLDPFKNCPPADRNNRVDMLYATDRALEKQRGGGEGYGYRRSPSLAFGRCIVGIGEDVSWPALAENSVEKRRSVSLPLKIESIVELGRAPAVPVPLVKIGNRFAEDPAVIAERDKVAQALRAEVSRRLAATPRKEAFVFIHGYNNTFEDTAFVMADLWHFLGRTGVPIVYTWPAGRGGLRGYNYDRESGEFTVFHLKNFLKGLAACPDLEKIHLLSHSRGTDVLSSAIRELVIEDRAAGKDPKKTLKVATLTMAAPDIDLEVFTQRMGGDKVGLVVGRVTIYVSEEDKALGLSTWLFSSLKRVGRLAYEDLSQQNQKRLAKNPFLSMIDARVRAGFIGHSYFYSDPAVSSDLILLMGHYRAPGPHHGRPLNPVAPNFWRIEKGYPYQQN
jgi:esterase/lipase superfamily enzyme